MLEMLGCRVDIARSGTEAVRLFSERPYDLVFMDCQMPEMDGYETTAAILKLEQDGAHTPIIAMTAHAMKGARQECLDAGMDDYISKPVTIETLRVLLRRWLVPEEEEDTNALPTRPEATRDQSAAREQPDDEAQPDDGEQPAAEPKPAEGSKPTPEPMAPDGAKRADEAEKLDKAEKSDETEKADNAKKTNEAEKPDEAEKIDEEQPVPVLSD